MNPNVKPDDYGVPEKVLTDAADAIKSRGKEHGHTKRSFTMVAELWSTYIQHVFTIRGEAKLRADDIAQMQGMIKMVRSVYGESGDNYVDLAGYSALAAMLRPPAPPAIVKSEPQASKMTDFGVNTTLAPRP